MVASVRVDRPVQRCESCSFLGRRTQGSLEFEIQLRYKCIKKSSALGSLQLQKLSLAERCRNEPLALLLPELEERPSSGCSLKHRGMMDGALGLEEGPRASGREGQPGARSRPPWAGFSTSKHRKQAPHVNTTQAEPWGRNSTGQGPGPHLRPLYLCCVTFGKSLCVSEPPSVSSAVKYAVETGISESPGGADVLR